METNRKSKTTKESNPIPKVKIVIVPTYWDEDPELTPERWWSRRQQQSLNNF